MHFFQELQHVYEENGHVQSWVIDDGASEARGNPLEENDDIEALRQPRRVHFSQYEAVTLPSRSITADQVCSRAEIFWSDLHNFAKKVLVPILEMFKCTLLYALIWILDYVTMSTQTHNGSLFCRFGKNQDDDQRQGLE